MLGIEARIRALLSDGPVADGFYRESVERLGRTRVRAELARSHLLYGEWLRRERRRAEAREQLRTAHRMLEEMGMEAFAERARRELRATGETARTRTVPAARAAGAGAALTPQEAQVARLARKGLSNLDSRRAMRGLSLSCVSATPDAFVLAGEMPGPASGHISMS